MMFRPKQIHQVRNAVRGAARLVATVILAIAGWAVVLEATPALAEPRFAVVPKRTIYPGEQIDSSLLEEVEVTNPNIAPGYVEEIAAVDGLVTKKTLLAGRIILVSALREPYAVSRGKAVQLVFQNGPLTIRASGMPLEDASVGDLIKIRNMDSGVIVSGTVMGDHSVHVVAK